MWFLGEGGLHWGREEKVPRTMKFEFVVSMSRLRNDQILCITCSVLYFFIQAISGVVVSIYVAAGMRRSGVCEGHDTEVPPADGNVHGWNSTIGRVAFHASLDGGGTEVYVPPPGPHQGSSGVLGHI
jgi:hypothetical protein